MRISDWSSAVCSSDLFKASLYASDVEDVLKKQYVNANYGPLALMALGLVLRSVSFEFRIRARAELKPRWILDRQSVVQGQRAAARVDLGGRRITKTQQHENTSAPETITALKKR